MQEESDREALNQMTNGYDAPAVVQQKPAAPMTDEDIENPISALMAMKHPERLEAIKSQSLMDMQKSHYAGDDE